MITEVKIKRGLLVVVVIILGSIWVSGDAERPRLDKTSMETELDLPGSFVRYYDYGERVNAWRARYGFDPRENPDFAFNSPEARDLRKRDDLQRNTESRLAKLVKMDLDGDMNYDGTIDNSNPADGGYYETTPPGLVLGVGEMTKLIVRFRLMNRGKWKGRVAAGSTVVVTAEVVGINRKIRSGLFVDFEQEKKETGRIRVWRDEDKKKLILDSGVEGKRVFEWTEYDHTYQGNMPWGVPRMVYVEGVSPSKTFSGDIRLLFTVSFRENYRCCDSGFTQYGKKIEKGKQRGWSKGRDELVKYHVIHGDQLDEDGRNVDEPLSAGKESLNIDRYIYSRGFRATYDHMLFTIRPKPHRKEFISNNIEKIWLKVNGKSE
ncbi:MAG: hypothetical protein L3J39_07735 [Verrucomicrobiales bacterium]|nr:hypothetical protein [Verrucomicrobiales bacterium]